MSPLQTQKLTKVLNQQRVLREIDLVIEQGERVAIQGHNGAGKTTLLQCLAGLIRPTSGIVQWFGDSKGTRRNSQSVVGYVGHESHLYLELTALENLVFAAGMHRIEQPEAKSREWLRRIDLNDVADRPVEQFSRGMRQRLSIVRALIHEPPIVLLDEPYEGMDGKNRSWLDETFNELKDRNSTVVFSMHDEQKSGRYADRVLQMECGHCHELTLGLLSSDAARSSLSLDVADSKTCARVA